MSVHLSTFWFPDSNSAMLPPIHSKFDRLDRTQLGLAYFKIDSLDVSVCLCICRSIFWLPDSNTGALPLIILKFDRGRTPPGLGYFKIGVSWSICLR